MSFLRKIHDFMAIKRPTTIMMQMTTEWFEAPRSQGALITTGVETKEYREFIAEERGI